MSVADAATVLDRLTVADDDGAAGPGSCRYCGCTEDRACVGGCSWHDESRTVCSRCGAGVEIAKILAVACAQLRTPLASVIADWSAVPVKEQRLLTVSARAAVEIVESEAAEDLAILLKQYRALLDRLEARHPALVAKAADEGWDLVELVEACGAAK